MHMGTVLRSAQLVKSSTSFQSWKNLISMCWKSLIENGLSCKRVTGAKIWPSLLFCMRACHHLCAERMLMRRGLQSCVGRSGNHLDAGMWRLTIGIINGLHQVQKCLQGVEPLLLVGRLVLQDLNCKLHKAYWGISWQSIRQSNPKWPAFGYVHGLIDARQSFKTNRHCAIPARAGAY